MQREKFDFVEVCEILLRYYKTNPERLRPVDRMVAHTGYLVFACKTMLAEDEAQWEKAEGETVEEDELVQLDQAEELDLEPELQELDSLDGNQEIEAG